MPSSFRLRARARSNERQSSTGSSRARNRRFVSIVAPPGSGKTTALAQWAEREQRRFAWVSLDRRDNDPVVLLSYLAEALSPDDGVDPATLDGLTAGSLWTRALPRLGVALASLTEPFVLVLDDVHELENPECLDALAAVLGQVPQGSQLVLSGRTEARLGLAKLRADGELLELGRSALALNDREAHALLTAAGLNVTETEAFALNERAEGWAAGLYLAALSLEAGDSSLASFGGDDRFVTDYLRSEELGLRQAGGARVPASDRGSRPDVWAAVRCGSRAPGLDLAARATRARQPVRDRPRPPADVVSLPPSVPGDAGGGATAARARARHLAECQGGLLVRGERRVRGRDRVPGSGRRHRRGRPARDGLRVSVLPERPGHDGRALARAVRRTGEARELSRDRSLRGVDARIARPARCG